MRRRRTALWLAGGLLFVAVALVAAGLIWPRSWAGRLLSGAGVDLEKEPTVFPAEHVIPASVPLDMQSLESDQQGTTVTFDGLWDGWCRACGVDAAHPDGVEYYAGTLRIEIEGQERAGYCIDLARTLETGDTYQAAVRVPAGGDLCAVYWLLNTYNRERPGPGLNSREEGAAIQAAVWHLLDGFQPEWDPGCWCYKQSVYDRAMEMINAARGQCTTLPDTVSLVISPETLPVAGTAELVATVADYTGHPLVDRRVIFTAELGELAQMNVTSNAQGQATTQVQSNVAGTGQVSAISAGTFPFAAVIPIDASRQPVLIQNPTLYYAPATRAVTWVAESPQFGPVLAAQRVFLPLCVR